MDGVLLDSEITKAHAWKTVLQKYKISNGDLRYKEKIGRPGLELCNTLKEEFSLSLDPEQFLQEVRSVYIKILEGNNKPILSSIKFLKSLSNENVKLGLASSEYKKFIISQMENLKILELFHEVISGAEEVDNDKPHPEIYSTIANKLNLNPKDCLAIEDTEAGVHSAKSAGMKCIGFRNLNSGNQDLSRADIITDNLSRLKLNEIV